jgi:hypothetical protein
MAGRPVDVRVEGVPETVRALEAIGHDAALPPPNVAEVLAGGIALEAPVRTGYLRSTITPLHDAQVIITAPYAVYVDAAQGFTARGAARAHDAIVEAWQKNVDDVIRREGAA